VTVRILRRYGTETAEYAQVEMPDGSRMEFKLRDAKVTDASFLAMAQAYWDREAAEKPVREKAEKLARLDASISNLQSDLGSIIGQWKVMTAKQQQAALAEYPMLATLKNLTAPMAAAIEEVK